MVNVTEHNKEADRLRDVPAPPKPAEGVREQVRELVEEWCAAYPALGDLQSLVDRIAAFVEERERLAVEAEREACCKEVCRHCCKANPTVSDHGFWRHDLGAGQFAFCDASPIRARKPSEVDDEKG